MTPTRVLIAPDKFKGCLSAGEVTEAIRSGIELAGADVSVETLPLADGGDGSVDVALVAGARSHPVLLTDETGALIESRVAFDGETAVIEVATTCGLAARKGKRSPMSASSRALGDALLAAVRLRPSRIVVGLGGSASTDGGAGMLDALGVRFLDAVGARVRPSGATLSAIVTADWADAVDLSGIEVIGASDVTNPLFGEEGAAAVFAPQKGATPEEVALLEAGLRQLSAVCSSAGAGSVGLSETPGAGSAGGIGFGILLLGGALVSGADYFLDLLDFDARAARADIVVTGEGLLDAQTADGKLISAVCRRSSGSLIWAVVGHSALTAEEVAALGIDRVVALTALSAADTSRDPAGAARLLAHAGGQIGAYARRSVDVGGVT